MIQQSNLWQLKKEWFENAPGDENFSEFLTLIMAINLVYLKNSGKIYFENFGYNDLGITDLSKSIPIPFFRQSIVPIHSINACNLYPPPTYSLIKPYDHFYQSLVWIGPGWKGLWDLIKCNAQADPIRGFDATIR